MDQHRMRKLATGVMCSLAVVIAAAIPRGAIAQVGGDGDILNPNLASADQLRVLRLGAAIIEAIGAGRPWLDMGALDAALGEYLDTAQRSELYERLFLPLNLNEARSEEIMLISGVGERMTHEFEEYRPYASLGQFRREIGKYVDDDEVARLEQYVFVPIDLNTASREEILTIPGVGARMAHEFEEYRPYTSLAQFRREIGKYVDDDEVARLERYVTLDN